MDVIGDDVCERITALGLFGCTCGMFVFALVSQPFVEAKEDRVDASVRFAGTVTAFALILVVYSVVEDWVALVLVVELLVPVLYSGSTRVLTLHGPGEQVILDCQYPAKHSVLAAQSHPVMAVKAQVAPEATEEPHEVALEGEAMVLEP